MYFRLFKLFQVENIGFEPMTSSMPWKRPDRSGPAELTLDLTLNVLPAFHSFDLPLALNRLLTGVERFLMD
jgi:hypothetical protein